MKPVQDIREAQQRVVDAGIRLVETGLIARTWGNVSHRISADQFVITPSGRDYRSLEPDDIVVVNIADGSYSGAVKPSSERRAHAAAYKQFPDVNFVIHTHQTQASVISAAGLDAITIEDGPLAGEVLCGAYALPSTKRLTRNVAAALARTNSRALIMKNHGALCFGADAAEAFNTALELESACERFVAEAYRRLSGASHADLAALSRFALAHGEAAGAGIASSSAGIGAGGTDRQTMNPAGNSADASPLRLQYNSRRTGDGLTLYRAGDPNEIAVRFGQRREESKALTEETAIHEAIYTKHSHIRHTTLNRSPEAIAFSETKLTLKPLLDDFAQLIGTSAIVAEADPGSITSALKRSSAVFVRGQGALCCSGTQDDAAAVSMVLDKNCKAHVGASLFGSVKPIHYLESVLMRFVYVNQYSKKASKLNR